MAGRKTPQPGRKTPEPGRKMSQAERLEDDLLRARRVIRAALRLLDRPGRWTRRALARDAGGREVLPDDSRAVRWCVNGALLREGARIDKVTLQLRRGAQRGNIGAEDVNVPPSSLLAILAVADLIHVQFAETGSS